MNIRVIAPSSKKKDISDIIDKFIHKAKNINLQITYDKKIFENNRLPFFASSEENIFKDLRDAILDKNNNILWAARGGYGAANHVQNLLDVVPSGSKTIIGFSDITALHILFNQYYNIPTIHAPVITSFIENNNSFNDIINLLNGSEGVYEINPVNNISENLVLNSSLHGGNLAVITTLIGTKIHPNFDDKILILEDVNEKGYQIHRNLMHLKNAGLLQKIKALILGEFTLGDDIVENTILDFIENEIDVPVFRMNNFGHVPNNLPIILGSEVIIKNNKLHVKSPFNFNYDK